MDPIILGIIGVAFILVGFLLDEFNTPVNQDSESYQILNIVGSGFLAYYSYILGSIPFIVLNAVWFIASFYKLTRILYRR